MNTNHTTVGKPGTLDDDLSVCHSDRIANAILQLGDKIAEALANRRTTEPQPAKPVRTRFIDAFGQTRATVEWSREFGLPPGVIRHRLRRGWKAEDAVSLPIISRRTRL